MIEDKEKDPYGFYIYRLDIKDRRTPKIIDYVDEEYRDRIINYDEIIIKDEKIIIRITYPLSVEVVHEYEKKGGFSRKDLFQYIYEAYKEIYDEEESSG